MNSADFRGSLKQFKSPFFEIFVFIVCIILVMITKDFFYISNASILCHNFITFFNIVLSAKIALISFYTYPIISNNRFLFSGVIFLFTVILDLPRVFNLTSGTLINPDHNISLSLSARLVSSIVFALVFSKVSDDKKEYKKGKILFIYLPLFIFSLIFIWIIFYYELKFGVFIEAQGITLLGKLFVLLTIALNLYSIWCIYKQCFQNGFLYRRLFCIFLFMIFSSIALNNIKSIYDLSHILSNTFLTASYLLITSLYYFYGIKRPHMLLLQAKEERNKYIKELDELVEKRTVELRTINEKLLVDQEIARRIQFSMLPKTLPKNDYASFSSCYVPADNLSGDFYNVFKIDDVRFGICIGDVSGHGVSAAMLTIFIFQKLQSLMEEQGGEGMAIPSVVLSHLYDSLNASNFDENMYAVMVYGVFNSETGIFSYSSGGLNTVPLRVRPDGSIQELDNSGFAICKLGNFYKPRFVNNQILLFPNDKLILYTDGLVEARNSKNEEYSLQRLKHLIREEYKWGVEHLTEAISTDVQEFIGQKPSDDITLLILDVLPPF